MKHNCDHQRSGHAARIRKMMAGSRFTAVLVFSVTLSPWAQVLTYAQNASIDWEYKDLDDLFVDGGKHDPIYLENAERVMDGLMTLSGTTLPKLDIPESWIIRHSYNINDLNQYRELSGADLNIRENRIVMLLTSRPLEDTQSGYSTPVQVHDENGDNISISNPLAASLLERTKSIVLNSNDVWGDWADFPIETVASEKSYNSENMEPPLFILSSTLIHESFHHYWNPGNWKDLVKADSTGESIWTGEQAIKHFHRGLRATGLHPDFVAVQNLTIDRSGHLVNWLPIPDGRIRSELYQFSPAVSNEVSLVTNSGGGDGGVTVLDALLLKDMGIELAEPERFADPLPPTDESVLARWRVALANISKALQDAGTLDAEVRDFMENRMGISAALSEDAALELMSAMDESFAKAIASASVNNAPGRQLEEAEKENANY